MPVKNIFKILFLLAVIVVPVYYFRTDFSGAYAKVRSGYLVKPCSEPITYSISGMDERFGLTPDELLAAVQAAENLWENSAGRNLFQYEATGSRLSIGLVYDYRQDTTQKLNSLDQALDSDKDKFDQLKARHDSSLADYNSQVAALKSAVEEYNAAAAAYQDQVRYYNQRGGAPRDVYDELTVKRAELDRQLESIRSRQTAVDGAAAKVNELAKTLNDLIGEYNLGVKQYNLVGEAVPPEYEEGNYTGGLDHGQITVYQFADREKLVRVLAHEMGHALGIEHIDDPEDIMYSLNIGENDQITAADLSALDGICSAPYGWQKLWLDLKNAVAEKI